MLMNSLRSLIHSGSPWAHVFSSLGVREGRDSPQLQIKRSNLKWDTVTATNPHANQDESDLWKGDSTSCDVDGKKRQTNARRVTCLNKSANGNHLGQNDPHPPTIDDKDPGGGYEVARASFATSSRTRPLSRAFSFVKWRPRLSTSRRTLLDSFAPSRSTPLIFFGASSPS
jgi:hypothetical protein